MSSDVLFRSTTPLHRSGGAAGGSSLELCAVVIYKPPCSHQSFKLELVLTSIYIQTRLYTVYPNLKIQHQ